MSGLLLEAPLSRSTQPCHHNLPPSPERKITAVETHEQTKAGISPQQAELLLLTGTQRTDVPGYICMRLLSTWKLCRDFEKMQMNSTEMVRIPEFEPLGKLRCDRMWTMYLLLLPAGPSSNFSNPLLHLLCCTICQSSKTPVCRRMKRSPLT